MSNHVVYIKCGRINRSGKLFTKTFKDEIAMLDHDMKGIKEGIQNVKNQVSEMYKRGRK